MKFILVLIFSISLFGCTSTPVGPVQDVREAPIDYELDSAKDMTSPFSTVRPKYPPQAFKSGQTGWVLMEYVVNEDGITSNIVVIDSSPKKIFDRASIRVAKGFVYNPRLINGKAVMVSGVRKLIKFDL